MAGIIEQLGNFQADVIAKSVLDTHWDGMLPVNPVKIAQDMGVVVKLHDFDDDTVVDSGIKAGKPTILLSRKTYQAGGNRVTFAVAHALGHICLHGSQLRNMDEPAAAEEPAKRSPRP